MYQAVRGNRGTGRLVFLPAEAHGYRVRGRASRLMTLRRVPARVSRSPPQRYAQTLPNLAPPAVDPISTGLAFHLGLYTWAMYHLGCCILFVIVTALGQPVAVEDPQLRSEGVQLLERAMMLTTPTWPANEQFFQFKVIHPAPGEALEGTMRIGVKTPANKRWEFMYGSYNRRSRRSTSTRSRSRHPSMAERRRGRSVRARSACHSSSPSRVATRDNGLRVGTRRYRREGLRRDCLSQRPGRCKFVGGVHGHENSSRFRPETTPALRLIPANAGNRDILPAEG